MTIRIDSCQNNWERRVKRTSKENFIGYNTKKNTTIRYFLNRERFFFWYERRNAVTLLSVPPGDNLLILDGSGYGITRFFPKRQKSFHSAKIYHHLNVQIERYLSVHPKRLQWTDLNWTFSQHCLFWKIKIQITF